MKKPDINEVRRDDRETRQIRTAFKNQNSIKITINIDSDSIKQLREIATKSGIPYQRLLNKFLREGLEKNDLMETRLEKLETELKNLKKKVA